MGEKISATDTKQINTIENQIMQMSSNKNKANPVLRDDMDVQSVHSKLSKLGGLSRAKSTASIQSASSSVATYVRSLKSELEKERKARLKADQLLMNVRKGSDMESVDDYLRNLPE